MDILAPKPDTLFAVHNGRLALFHKTPESKDYWNQYWKKFERGGGYETQANGDLTYFARYLDWIPKKLPVLEAGCGNSIKLVALHKQGYQCCGVDYEEDVVSKVNQCFPFLDVSVQDISKLQFSDSSIGCYFSGGVIEHFEDGPLDVLKEAHRVLTDDGVGLISVPYLNPRRLELQHKLTRESPKIPEGYHFHQYYFNRDNLEPFMLEAGFSIEHVQGEHAIAFLTREHPLFARFWNSSWCRHRIKNLLRPKLETLSEKSENCYGHMAVFVVKKLA